MYKTSRQVLKPENIRKIISKYSSSSKSKKPDQSKNSRKLYKTKQFKSKVNQISTANVVMEAFNAAGIEKNDDGNKNNDVRNSEASRYFPLAYSKYRTWKLTNEGYSYYQTNKKEDGTVFTLVSYNILAQDLLEIHDSIYKNHKKKALSWSHRIAQLTNELLSIKPHIICLQEVQNDHLESLKANLESLNCECIYKKKTGFRTDGCAILYNKEMFEMKEYKSIEFFQPNIERLDRENVGIVAKMRPKGGGGGYFLVATTHLLYNPKRQDVRLAQIQVLLAELDQLSFKGFYKDSIPERFPIILTGDFNLKPYSAPYKLLTLGELNYSNLTHLTLEPPNSDNITNVVGKKFLPPHLGITDSCQHIDVIANNYNKPSRLHHSSYEIKDVEINVPDIVESSSQLFSSGYLRHGLNLKSVYHHTNSTDEPYASTYQDEWITVDYIFYSKSFDYDVKSTNNTNLKLLSRYILPTVNQCDKMGMIPNERLGSDHLALAANFLLTYVKKQS